MQIATLMHRDVVTLSEDDSLALAVQLMGWNGIHHLPVMSGSLLVGMLSDRDLLARSATGGGGFRVFGRVGDAMRSPVKAAPPTMSVEEAAAVLLAERINALPIVEDGRLVGVVTSTDILGHVAKCEVPPDLDGEPAIGGLMVRRVVSVSRDDELTEAAARMAQNGIRHLPVLDAEGRIVGILSERDIRAATGSALLHAARGARASSVRGMRVRDAMTENPRTVSEDDSLGAALRALIEDRFGALPVVDEADHLVGILSYVDLLRYLGARMAAEATEASSAGRTEPARAP